MEDTKTNQVLVNVVLDRSGSMAGTREETISGYNAYIETLRSKDKETEYAVSLIQFYAPSDVPELTVKYAEKPLAEIAPMTAADYEPRGWTPLYDAIGECIRRVETKGRSVLTVIITDGLENASREFTKDSIKRMIAEKEKEGWTFAFLGANIDSYEVGGSVGVSSFNTSNYVPGKEKAMYSALAQSTMTRSAHSRSFGVMAAASLRMFDDSQRASMGDDSGGRPAAPENFPVPAQTKRPWRPNLSDTGASR